LPDHIRQVLTVAACLGSSFDRSLLELVWNLEIQVSFAARDTLVLKTPLSILYLEAQKYISNGSCD
jgi:predicted ATPase